MNSNQKISIKPSEKQIEDLVRDWMETELAQKKDIFQAVQKIIHHDMINNLTVLNGMFEILIAKGHEEAKQGLGALNRLFLIADRIQSFTDLIYGIDSLRPLKVKPLIESVIEHYDFTINVNGDCCIEADQTFFSVIDNIVNNAIIHSNTNKIDINISKNTNNECKISIIDYGIGIPDEIKNKIFSEGFKYGKNGNLGLGLYLVNKIIEKYKGKVVLSDNKPKGSIFTLILPECNTQ